MLLLFALVELNAGQIQSDRLTELARFAGVSELCRDLGYVVVDDFGQEFEQRVFSEGAAQGATEAAIQELLEPRIEAVVTDSVAQLENALAALEQTGNTAPLSSLLARRDQICLRMTMDALTSDLISAGSEVERVAARDERVQAIAQRFR